MGLNIGFKDDDTFEAYLRSIGMEKSMFDLIVENDYDTFIRKLRLHLLSKTEDNTLDQDDLDLLSQWTEEDFNDMKKQSLVMKSLFDKRNDLLSEDDIIGNDGNITNRKEEAWRPDYRVLLNGNFPKLDKTQLSDETKKAFDVYGLDDRLYDIYYDSKSGNCLPVYYDWVTNNEHFFAFAVFLEEFKHRVNIPGLNSATPLILFDRTLLGVDTDLQLTPIMQSRVLMEIKRNPIFYMRECARTFDKTTGKNVRFQINIADWNMIWLYCQCISTYREQSRQTGKTFLLNYLGGMEWSVGSTNTLALIVHYKSEEAGKNRRKMVESVNMLPKFLKLHTIKKVVKKGKELWEEGPENPTPTEKGKNFYNPRLSNNLKIAAVGSTESSASQTGRGDSVKFGFVDELNYIKNASTMLTALQFAHGTARLLAEKAGERYGLHFVSTAGELNTKNGKEMYKLTQEEMCKFDIKLFGYCYEDLVTYLNKNSTKGFFTILYQYDELGFQEDWIENSISLSTSREKFQMDILSRWQAVDLNALFGVSTLTRINQIVKDTKSMSFMFEKFSKIEYYPRRPDQTFEDYIKSLHAISIGVDIALGTGGDYSVLKAHNLETAKSVFLYRHNKLNAFDFGILIREFVRYIKKIHPDLMIVLNIESDGPGQVLIPMLSREPDIEPMLFRTLEFYNKQFKNTTIKATTKHLDTSRYVRYGTAMRTYRNELMNILLFDLVDKYPYVFDNPDAFSELTTLQRKRSGKIEHGNGFHDDTIMATLHALSPIFLNKFREQLERFFNFVVDFRKIENLPMESHIVAYEDIEANNNIEGKITWDIITKLDSATGEEYDEILMEKVENGIKRRLSPDEITYEISHNPDLVDNARIKAMRLKPVNAFSSRLAGSEESERAIKELDNLSYSVTNNSRVRSNQNARLQQRRRDPYDVNRSNSRDGSQLSHDTRRGSDYYKANANNYNASLI